jgi:hypothetical protein
LSGNPEGAWTAFDGKASANELECGEAKGDVKGFLEDAERKVRRR